MRSTLLLFLALAITIPAFSQDADSLKKDKKVDFSVMPYLSYNRNLKFMFWGDPDGHVPTESLGYHFPKVPLRLGCGIHHQWLLFCLGFQ